MKPMGNPSVAALMILLISLMLGGCYWTPQGEEKGGVTVEIRRGEVGSSSINGFNGFFLGYVIAGDLLSGDRAAADRAFEEVGAALDRAFEEIQSPQDLGEFQLNLSFPAIQLQAEYFVESSGSSTFGGLRAGREYLVVVLAFDFNNTSDTYNGDIGFRPVTIEGGQSQTVNLELGDNWAAFDRLVRERYGYQSERAAIELQKGSPNPYYIDLLPGSVADPGPISATFLPSEFDTWYNSITILNRSGASISKTGTRPEFSASANSFLIDEVAPNLTWRILLTEWPNRDGAPTSGNFSFYISSPFSVTEGETLTIPFILGDGDGFSDFTVSP